MISQTLIFVLDCSLISGPDTWFEDLICDQITKSLLKLLKSKLSYHYRNSKKNSNEPKIFENTIDNINYDHNMRVDHISRRQRDIFLYHAKSNCRDDPHCDKDICEQNECDNR